MVEQTAAECGDPKNSQEIRRGNGLGRLAGIGVFAAVTLPILLAYLVFYTGIGMPSNTINQGKLLEPAHNVGALNLQSPAGEPVVLADQEPKWRYLIVAGTDCLEKCEQLLYTSRQVHVRLSEKARRVERLLLTAAPLPEARARQLAQEYPQLRMVIVDGAEVDRWLADSNHANLSRPSVLLVDQQGFAMMVYDEKHSGNQLLKDIKRLLKYSYEQ